MKIDDIGNKQLPETVFMHEKACFIVGKQGLNSHKTMSFTVGKRLLAGGIKKDVDKQKTETDIFRGKERKNVGIANLSRKYGNGDLQ